MNLIKSISEKKKNENQFLFYNITFSLFCLLFSSIGLIVDDRILQYSPIWLKPFKFAFSSLLFSSSLYYFNIYLPKSKLIKMSNMIIGSMLNLELAIIYFQAYRGRMSHFNYTTLEDMILFQLMAFGIIAVWIVLFAYVFFFLKLNVKSNLILHAIRISLVITFLSMASAFTMTTPNKSEVEKIVANKGIIGLTVGSHSVAEKDPSQVMPITKWALTGGDLRIAHFVGLHAIQILPLIAFFFLLIKLDYKISLFFVYTLAFMYFAIFLFVLLQALQGIPLVVT